MKAFAVMLLMILMVVVHCDADAKLRYVPEWEKNYIKRKIKRITNGGSISYKVFQAMVEVESGYRTEIKGDKEKAYGLFQVHKKAAQDVKYYGDMEALVEDADIGILCGMLYLYSIYNRLDKNLPCAISAFNKGPNRPDINGNCEHHRYYKKVNTVLRKL